MNVQHDCFSGGCQATGSEFLWQEREQTTHLRSIVRHTDSHNFILNMHALHNHSHIRRAILPSLSKPPDPGLNRVSLRNEAATELQDQALQKKFSRETRARKAAEDARHAQTAGLDDLEALLEDPSAIAAVADAPSEYELGSMPPPPSPSIEVITSSMLDPQPQPRGPRKRHPAKSKPRATTTRPSDHPETLTASAATATIMTSPQSTTQQPSPPRKRRRASTKTSGNHAA